ncbi:hypothetical protein DXV75_13070 [Alteromonas aestuariivivens]|uniref:FlgO domain-containing protein n=1 Tax=Alteromonas aestuariivivens TaxID=1938339 RepID=A0A3D8M4Z0_9ALTE|nr:hypothetical protein DXV75_13070 [Alteromonas aestuariivivens]
MRFRYVAIAILIGIIAAMSGCTTHIEAPVLTQAQIGEASQNGVPALGNVEYHTHLLANELFIQLKPSRQARYAVAGFVPADTLNINAEEQHPLMMLSQQLEQGLITEGVKRGFIAQEFKLTNDILIEPESDRVLSRNIEHLSDAGRVDFYITGTMVYQQEGAIVNARVINAQTKDVVAAATRFFPQQLFWREEQVSSRNGRLYRTEHKG